MAWHAGRIPVTVMPLPGEALESWVGAYARRLHTSDGGFLDHVGLRGARLHNLALRLTEGEAQVLQRATGVPQHTLTAMTLEPFDELAVSILPDRRKLGRPPAWRFSGSRTRYCPACLRDTAGRGPLFWRLPWAFACDTHHQVLVDFCPDCHRPPLPWRTRRLGRTTAGRCTLNLNSYRTGGTPRLCGSDLAHADAISLPAGGFVLSAHRHLVTLLNTDTATRPAALAELKQLYALAWRVLRGLHTVLDHAPAIVHTVVDECGGALPLLTPNDVGRDAHNVAVGTALARIALHPGHRDHDALFEWIMLADRSLLQPDQRYPIGVLAKRWRWAGTHLVSRALAHLDTEATLHARLRYATATPSPRWPQQTSTAIKDRAARLPAMLWPSWSMRLLPRDRPDARRRADAFRRGCSSFLLLPGGPPQLNFERVAPLLGNDRIDRDRDSIERRRYRDRDLTPLASALAQLAHALDEHLSPIDYARRRALFTARTVHIDRDAYQRFLLQHGWPVGGTHRLLLMGWYLLLLLTGESHAPPADASRRFAWHCTEFRLRAPTLLRAFLRQQARRILNDHSIHEPVTWEPPTQWITSPDWPGVDPADIDDDAFHHTVTEAASADEAAAPLRMTAEHVRLYCDITETHAAAPSAAIGHIPTPANSERGTLLNPERLRDLYLTQQLSVTHIANRASCSPPTVRKLLQHDGIPLRPAPAPPMSPESARTWLQREHTEKRRPMSDLAHEYGISSTALAKKARTWGIQVHGPGSYNALGHLNLPTPPSPALQAITRSNHALDRLRVIVQIPGHNSLADAARAIYNGNDHALRQRIQGIERRAGFKIIDRSMRPLTPTEKGRQLIAEATQVLELSEASHSAAREPTLGSTSPNTPPTDRGDSPCEVHSGLQRPPLAQIVGASSLDEIVHSSPGTVDIKHEVASEAGQLLHDRDVDHGIRSGRSVSHEQ